MYAKHLYAGLKVEITDGEFKGKVGLLIRPAKLLRKAWIVKLLDNDEQKEINIDYIKPIRKKG